jgi:hypothetical protein
MFYPAQVAVLMGLAGLPWVVKPLYGFISDSVPLFGYRRRSYLILCGLAGAKWPHMLLLLLLETPGICRCWLGAASATLVAA